MGTNPQIENLKNKLLHKEGIKRTVLTDILDLAREFSCLGEIIGRKFVVKDENGKLIATIEQRPMALKQLNTVMKELSNLKKIDAENEAKKFGGKKGMKRPRR